MKTAHSQNAINRISSSYISLVLAVGEHDPDYVDAYYGPEELRAAVKSEKPGLPVIRQRAIAALAELQTISPTRLDALLQLRHGYLSKQLRSLVVRVDLLGGKKLTFDDEARGLYDAAPPTFPESHFAALVEELNALLPGKGSVPQRFGAFKNKHVIPQPKLDAVFTAAIEESRKRTRQWITLPEQESFVVEYVTGKSWSGYNWFKGNAHSVIQINTEFPVFIDRAVDLASHEGYPGHHVYNSLLETKLVRERKWMEFSVYALFSPQSLIAEGTANYGIDMAFPGAERAEFERDVLFPLAGLPPAGAEHYYQVHALFLKLAYAGNEAARKYLNGEMTREKAVEWLVSYALMPKDRAEQRTKFFDQYRSYVINYNLGQDMVKRFIEGRGGNPSKPQRRWELFTELVSTPQVPSGLIVAAEQKKPRTI
jgi:hypothetical protein